MNNTTTTTTTTDTTKLNEWFFTEPLFFILVNILNLVLGLPLNAYVIILLLSPGLGEFNTTEVFTLNQAVSEIIFCLMGPFLSLCNADVGLCDFKLLGFITGFCTSARQTLQCCVCLERYLAVVHPVIFLRYRPLRYRVAHSLMAWASILGFGITCMLWYPRVPYLACSALYIIILVVDSFCCMSIVKKLRHPGPSDSAKGEREMNSFKRKAFQIVVMNLLIFCIQIFPMVITFGVQSKLSLSNFTKAMTVNVILNIMTGFVQPLFVLQKAGKLSFLRTVCFPKNRRP